jgi:hypothetical protein
MTLTPTVRWLHLVLLLGACTGDLGLAGDADDEATDYAPFSEPAPDGQAPLTLYLSTDGNDQADGRTADAPLATLEGAQQKLRTYLPVMDRNVEIRIARGTYHGQGGVQWSYTSPEFTVSFMPIEYQWGRPYAIGAGRPSFDGRSYCQALPTKAQCKLIQVAQDGPGQYTNVRFYFLEVRHYLTAGIVLGKNGHQWQGHNVVYGCRFQYIGTSFFPASEGPGYDAVGVHNSRENRIVHNHFVDLINSPGEEKYMHAVYISEHSTGNYVHGNHSLRVCGDPMKVRNYSNGNVFDGNTFERSGEQAFFLDWIDKTGDTDGDGDPEPNPCYSWRNVFQNNTLGCGYSGAPIDLTNLRTGVDQPSGCPALAPRVELGGNTSSCP